MGALPAFEQWKAPWEVDASGAPIPEDDQEIDKARLKKLVYELRKDKERQSETITSLTTERDQLKTQADEKTREGESEVDRLKREIAERDDKLKKAGDKTVEMLRLEAALEVGLPKKHVGRLNRDLTTLEELIADAKELQDSFGAAGKNDDEDTPRGRPRPRRNPADPDPDDDDLSVQRMLDATPVNPLFA